MTFLQHPASITPYRLTHFLTMAFNFQTLKKVTSTKPCSFSTCGSSRWGYGKSPSYCCSLPQPPNRLQVAFLTCLVPPAAEALLEEAQAGDPSLLHLISSTVSGSTAVHKDRAWGAGQLPWRGSGWRKIPGRKLLSYSISARIPWAGTYVASWLIWM